MRSATILILFAALLHHKGASNGNIVVFYYLYLINCNSMIVTIAQLANIWQIVNKNDGLTILATALKAAGLVEVSQQPGSIIVFAPTDEAFVKVSK